MTNNIKEQIKTDLQQAQEAGQLKAERIREIVKSAVSQVSTEFQEGSNEVVSLVNDAVSTVVENLQAKGHAIQDDVIASIQGAMEAVNSKKQANILKLQTELQQLQGKLNQEEESLQTEIEEILTKIVETNQDKSDDQKIVIDSAIDAIKDTEEVGLLKKRYAQLQAQIAIVKANLAARYSGNEKEVQYYLDDAKKWYEQTSYKAESVSLQIREKHSILEDKMRDVGSAIAKKESQLKQSLRDLLLAAADLFKDKDKDKAINS